METGDLRELSSWSDSPVKQFNSQGTVNYATHALNFYQSEGRVYALAFSDTSPDTLSNLQNFGATFHG